MLNGYCALNFLRRHWLTHISKPGKWIFWKLRSGAHTFRKPLPAQPVDATPSNQLIRQCLLYGTDL